MIRGASTCQRPKNLIDAVFLRGDPIAKVARVAADPRRQAGPSHRSPVLDPRFRYVAAHQSRWRPTRQVANACVLEGLSILDAAESFG